MSLMQLDVPPEINLLLRKYTLETAKGSREKSTLFIIENYLKEFYKIKEKEKR